MLRHLLVLLFTGTVLCAPAYAALPSADDQLSVSFVSAADDLIEIFGSGVEGVDGTFDVAGFNFDLPPIISVVPAASVEETRYAHYSPENIRAPPAL